MPRLRSRLRSRLLPWPSQHPLWSPLLAATLSFVTMPPCRRAGVASVRGPTLALRRGPSTLPEPAWGPLPVLPHILRPWTFRPLSTPRVPVPVPVRCMGDAGLRGSRRACGCSCDPMPPPQVPPLLHLIASDCMCLGLCVGRATGFAPGPEAQAAIDADAAFAARLALELNGPGALDGNPRHEDAPFRGGGAGDGGGDDDDDDSDDDEDAGDGVGDDDDDDDDDDENEGFGDENALLATIVDVTAVRQSMGDVLRNGGWGVLFCSLVCLGLAVLPTLYFRNMVALAALALRCECVRARPVGGKSPCCWLVVPTFVGEPSGISIYPLAHVAPLPPLGHCVPSVVVSAGRCAHPQPTPPPFPHSPTRCHLRTPPSATTAFCPHSRAGPWAQALPRFCPS